MNACRDIELEIAAYCSGELDPTDRASVRDHLDGCAACRAELAREMSLRHTLGSLPAVQAPEDFDNRVLASVHQAGKKSPWNRSAVRLATAASLVAASLVFAFILPALRPVTGPDPAWTQEEIASARQDVVYTLALTAKVIHRSQKDAVVDVFADRLPNAINDSVKKVKLTTSGGNG